MVYAPAFTPSSVFPLGVLPRAWLRPDRLRRFKAFLASSTCQLSASSYGVGSAAHSRPILSPGLTLRSSGRLRRRLPWPLVPVNLTLQSSWFFHRPSPSHAFIRWVFGRVSGFACNHFASFKSFLPPAHASQARAAIGLVALCIHAPFHRRG